MKKRFQWDITYLQWGITAFAVILCGIVVYFIFERWTTTASQLKKITNAFSPVVYGLMFAYLLGKIKAFIELKLVYPVVNRFFKRISAKKRITSSRGISIILTIGLTLFVIIGGAIHILPQLVGSLQLLTDSIPYYHEIVNEWLINTFADNASITRASIIIAENIIGRLANWIDVALLSTVESVTTSIIEGAVALMRLVSSIAVGFVISLYMMYNKELFIAQIKKTVVSLFSPELANSLIKSGTLLDRKVGSFITARLIDAVIIGLLFYLFNIVAKMPYPLLIAVICGVMNIIPFFGPFIGGIPSAVLILLINPQKSLIFAAFVVIIQMLDASVIYPKIQGNSLGLSGFWIISSLMVGGELFGFRGILLAVPAVAFLYTVFQEIVANRLQLRGLPVDTEDYMIYKTTKEDIRYDSHLY